MCEAFQMKITIKPGYRLLLTLDTGVYTSYLKAPIINHEDKPSTVTHTHWHPVSVYTIPCNIFIDTKELIRTDQSQDGRL